MVRPEQALMVGDSLSNAYRGAIAIGLRARHVPPGSTVREVLGDLLRASPGAKSKESWGRERPLAS